MAVVTELILDKKPVENDLLILRVCVSVSFLIPLLAARLDSNVNEP